MFRNDNFEHYKAAYGYLETLSITYNVGIDAIAMRFIMDALKPKLILSGASNTNQLKENLKVLSFGLDPNDIERLKSFAILPEAYWKERSNLVWN